MLADPPHQHELLSLSTGHHQATLTLEIKMGMLEKVFKELYGILAIRMAFLLGSVRVFL